MFHTRRDLPIVTNVKPLPLRLPLLHVPPPSRLPYLAPEGHVYMRYRRGHVILGAVVTNSCSVLHLSPATPGG